MKTTKALGDSFRLFLVAASLATFATGAMAHTCSPAPNPSPSPVPSVAFRHAVCHPKIFSLCTCIAQKTMPRPAVQKLPTTGHAYDREYFIQASGFESPPPFGPQLNN